MSKKSKHQHHEEHMDETWLIPYSDLLTLLLALFIVLFASSTIDAQKYNSMMESLSAAFQGRTIMTETGTGITQSMPVPDKIISEMMEQRERQIQKETMELERLKREIDQYIEDNNLSAALETGLNNENLMITIRDNALFDSGSAIVKPEFRKTILSISDMLLEYPHYEVVVSGHTDNVPINNREFESNWDLSSKRALNFMKIILSDKKQNPYRFSAIGYGEYRPVAANDYEEGRTKNRRVEVAIKRTVVKE